MSSLGEEGVFPLPSSKEYSIEVGTHNQKTGSIISTNSDGMLFYHYQDSSELVDNISNHSFIVTLGNFLPHFYEYCIIVWE